MIPLFAFSQYGAQDPLRAFPNHAYGGGAVATGGRANLSTVQLVIINTLDIDAPLTSVRSRVWEGGLKAAITDDLGTPRFVISNVSGHFEGDLPFRSTQLNDQTDAIYNSTPDAVSDMTIFGQSAPEGGINLSRDYIHIVEQTNIIVRHITTAPRLITGNPVGDDTKTTGLYIGASGSIIDHVSSRWGGDKAIILGDWKDGFPMINNTIQNCLATDSSTLFFMVDGRNVGADWSVATNISFVGNLGMGRHRTPNIGGFEGYGEVKNNLILSDGPRLTNITRSKPEVNVMGNYYRMFRTSAGTDRPNVYQLDDAGSGASTAMEIYTFQNYYEDDDGVVVDGTATTTFERDNIWTDFSANPVDNSLFVATEHTNTTTYQWPYEPDPLQARLDRLADIGHNRYLKDDGTVGIYQDTYDTAAIADATAGVLNFSRNSTEWVMPTIPTNTRPASYDTDDDGMCDAWEIEHYGDLSQDFYEDFDGDGVANLEEYLNQIDLEQTLSAGIKIRNGANIKGGSGSLKVKIGS